MGPTDLVVVESGASWTKWIETRESVGVPMIAVLQGHDEAAHDLVTRVRDRIERLMALGPLIRRFTLVGGENWNIPTLQARLAMLRSARKSGLPPGAIQLYLHFPKAPMAASKVELGA